MNKGTSIKVQKVNTTIAVENDPLFIGAIFEASMRRVFNVLNYNHRPDSDWQIAMIADGVKTDDEAEDIRLFFVNLDSFLKSKQP
jgi:hypothetical protein